MVIKRSTIFYFSGTGNSYQVARDLKHSLGTYDLLPMTSLRQENDIKVEAESIGLVFPVYYARLPLVVSEVVQKIRTDANTYVFAVATHGGGPSTVLSKLACILSCNQVPLHAGFLVPMPKNYIMSYGTKAYAKADRVFARASKKMDSISERVRKRMAHACEVSKYGLDRWVDRLFIHQTDKIMSELHDKDRGFWVEDSCNGCRICERICPVGNITCHDKPEWKHQCEQCAACIQYCPREAIQFGGQTKTRQRYRNPNIIIGEMFRDGPSGRMG